MASPFPHLTSTGPPPPSREVMNAYRTAFSARVSEGSLRPLVIPYHVYGYVLLIIYLCIPHTNRPWVYAARWPVLGVIAWWQWKTLWEASSMSMATGFAAGLMAAWGVVWACTWLVFNRPQFDVKRVQRSSANFFSDEKIAKQRKQNGNAKIETNGHATANGKSQEISKDGQFVAEYYWQSYPDTLKDRLPWVIDLVINFRGPGWNWAIPPLPSPPPSIMTQLSEPISASSRSGKSTIGLRRYDTFSALARARLPTFVVGYFLLDVLKVLMMQDPYFIFGPTTHHLPSYLQGLSPLALRFIRQALSSFSIILSLEMVFLLAPLIFSLTLGPSLLGLRAEPWYYPTSWGSFSNITTKGLNGLWGSWWHQTFRFAFSAPSNFLIAEGYVKAKSAAARISALVFAFGISGFLHAGGSISQFPRTFHWHAPMFFMLQAVGILVQSTLCALLHPIIRTLPRTVRQMGNFFYVFGWLFWTGWWLTDDFARGGIWLYEPIPISPLRRLGFGEKDAGWWCWEHLGVGWYNGKRWWESGIAV
ncbi:uncharacterized protein LY89DRAFT_637233 [Mollisia scopiformis]|uniref:Wax synthase domain-containing protein n=1 Tax=Mollisia scopiformis TaxID=149040 RepID=A0A194XS73_MOLSC|nr:uncharacterized protein LY89DRAFT_637233 [Mollisia scopiformis]KUJ22894.1 hypothetical protein LY89DRAFT_637233 [Mollisia scopiformis]